MKYYSVVIQSLFVVLCSLGSDLPACDHKDTSSVRQYSDRIVRLIQNEQIDSAFNVMGLCWSLDSNDLLDLRMEMKRSLQLWRSNYGRPASGSEHIKTVTAGASLFQDTYLVRRERSGVVIILLYYFGPIGWQLAGVNWYDRLDGVFPGK